MKKEAVIAVTLILSIGTGSALVGNNASGDTTITGAGSSASSSVSVGLNGTVKSSNVAMAGRYGSNVTDAVGEPLFERFDGKMKVSFNGSISAPDPCHVIDHSTGKEEENYFMEIETRKDELDTNSSACAARLTGIRYEAGFTAEEPYNLEIRHDGEKIKTIETPPQEETGFMEKLLDLVTSLVG